jgi:predicted nucleic acid-binding protein
MEVIQRLSLEENLPLRQARTTYNEILNKFQILELTAIWKYAPLTDYLIDTLATSNLDFKDALHLSIAKKWKIPLCTHDKKMRKNFSNHEEKIKFYEKVFKPEELL